MVVVASSTLNICIRSASTLQVESSKMAEPPSATVQALRKLEDQLTCGICLDSYTEPKLLQCFHVFCKQCLERLVVHDHQGLSLHCPTCHRSTLLPPIGVSGLQTAFYLNHLFEVRDALEKLKEPQKPSVRNVTSELQPASAATVASSFVQGVLKPTKSGKNFSHMRF